MLKWLFGKRRTDFPRRFGVKEPDLQEQARQREYREQSAARAAKIKLSERQAYVELPFNKKVGAFSDAQALSDIGAVIAMLGRHALIRVTLRRMLDEPSRVCVDIWDFADLEEYGPVSTQFSGARRAQINGEFAWFVAQLSRPEYGGPVTLRLLDCPDITLSAAEPLIQHTRVLTAEELQEYFPGVPLHV